MKWVGLTCVATSAAWIGLLAGCSPQHDGQQHGLTSESRLRVADAAEASGDRQTALSMYAAAANDAPNDTPTQLRSAEGLARNGGLEDASAVLTRRLKTTPHDADLQRTLGAIQVMAGEPARAIVTLSGVLAAKPNDTTALVNKAVALDILHKHDEAQGLYRTALLQSPDDLTISNDLALSLLLSGQREEARLTMLPFRDAPNLPERIRTNLGILDAANGHSAEARQLLGSRIGAGDLASLTQAISMQGAGFQPDAGRRIVSRGILTEPVSARAELLVARAAPLAVRAEPAAPQAELVAVHFEPTAARTRVVARMEPAGASAEPIARRDEPVVLHRPLQEQLAAHADLPVSPEPPLGVSRAAPPLQTVADAKPVPPSAVPVVLPVPRPSLPAVRAETAAARGAAMESRGPLQEDFIPQNVPAARVDVVAVPRSLVQEPLAPPEEAAVHADAPSQSHRPLQERVTQSPDPAVQRDTPTALLRPLQEQPTNIAGIAIGSAH